MEIQQYNTKKRVVGRTMSKYGGVKSEYSPRSVAPDKELQAKYTCKKVIKDSIVLREVCAQQAMILISQVYFYHSFMKEGPLSHTRSLNFYLLKLQFLTLRASLHLA